MPKPPARLITYAWGKEYIDKLLKFTLGSVLAPANLPALASEFDCTVVIVTEERFFEYIANHSSSKRVASICPLRLVPLDDIIGEPWQYGISLAYALFRGFAELGPAMTDTYLLFLNADFVIADGSYKSLIPHMLRGEPALLAPSYCTVAEQVAPLLGSRCDRLGEILSVPARELAEIILEHRHNTIRAKTINQQLLHFEYMDQSYWQVDAHTLFGHQMPISLVAMRPEVALDDLSTFWDWGVVYDFCPSKRLTVLGDSDDFLMLELREAATHLNLIRMGRTTPKAAASRMLGYITQYQIDAGRHPLTLHSRDLPAAAAGDHLALQRFVYEQIEHLTRKPKEHHNHPDWLYHKEHLRRYHKQKVRPLRQPEPVDAESAEADVETLAVDPTTTIRPDLLFRCLSSGTPVAFTRKRQLQDRTAPATQPWHPMYLAYRNTARALRMARAAKFTNILFVGPAKSSLAQLISGFPGTHYATLPVSVKDAGWENALTSLPAFAAVVIELSRADLPDAEMIYHAVRKRLEDAIVIFTWINTGDMPANAELEPGLVRLLTLSKADADVTFSSSAAARRAIEWAEWAWNQECEAGRMARGGALIVAAGLALSAALIHSTRSCLRDRPRPSIGCLNLTVSIRAAEPAEQVRRNIGQLALALVSKLLTPSGAVREQGRQAGPHYHAFGNDP